MAGLGELEVRFVAPHPIPSWQRRTVIRILLFVAKMVEEDDEFRKEIQGLANHLLVGM